MNTAMQPHAWIRRAAATQTHRSRVAATSRSPSEELLTPIAQATHAPGLTGRSPDRALSRTRST